MGKWKFMCFGEEYELNYDDMFYVTGECPYCYDGITSYAEYEKYVLESAFLKLSPKARASAAEEFYANNKIHEFFWIGKDAFVACGKYYEINIWGCVYTQNAKPVSIDDISFGHDLKAQISVKERLASSRDEERFENALSTWEETWINGN
jgi:hypothetical protein